MAELRVSQVIQDAERMLEEKRQFKGYCIINIDEIYDILDKIKNYLPTEIRDAEFILKRRDDMFAEAQNRAERIITEAQNEAARILSKSELLRAAEEQVEKIKTQVASSCEDLKNKAMSEANTIQSEAQAVAQKTKEQATQYVEDLLLGVETEVSRIYKNIKNCQDYIQQQKLQTKDNYNNR